MNKTTTMAVCALAAALSAVLVAACSSSTPPNPAAPITSATASASPTPVASPLAALPQTQLVPPSYTVDVDLPSGGTGLVFLTTGFNPGAAAAAADNSAAPAEGRKGQAGSANEIVDKTGRAVWLGALPAGQTAGDFQVQTYRGQPVLTWTQCARTLDECTNYIADEHYQVIAKVTAGTGFDGNTHEFRLTPDGHALLIGDKQVPYDLTPVGGPKDGSVTDNVALLVDVATNTIVSQWDSLMHVPIADSFLTAGDKGSAGGFDAYHMNSVALGADGNWIVSLRSTSSVYSVDPGTGAISWQLGGKHPTLAPGPGVAFAYQHDAQLIAPDTVLLFNNDNRMPSTKIPSSIQWIHLDPAAHTATLIRNQTHPDDLVDWATGNAQMLPNGNVFGSWGTSGHVAEFSPSGQLVYDATPNSSSYRSFLQDWNGHPSTTPEVVVPTAAAPDVHAVWNGATDVAQWQLLGGATADALSTLTTVNWNGLNTAIPLPPGTPATDYFQVKALDRTGAVIGSSSPTKASR